LVTTGHEFLADYLYVHYLNDTTVRFGFEHTSRGSAVGPPVTIEAEKSQAVPAEHVTSISQHDKLFTPTRVRVKRGERLWLLNNDTRTHNVRVFDEKFDFDSGAQEPGETVEIAFPKEGSYLVFCGIHPKMELNVEVTP